MAKRYYLCDILGDGSEANPYRPAVTDLGVNQVAVYPPQNPDGSYSRPHCLALVATPNHVGLRGRSPQIDPLADVSLDVKTSAINVAAKTAMEAALSRRGFTVTFAGKDGYRDVIDAVGKELDLNFSVDNFDVSE